MKILVTGAGGFLGRALIESLLAAGERDLRALVRPGSARPGQVEICEGTLGRALGASLPGHAGSRSEAMTCTTARWTCPP